MIPEIVTEQNRAEPEINPNKVFEEYVIKNVLSSHLSQRFSDKRISVVFTLRICLVIYMYLHLKKKKTTISNYCWLFWSRHTNSW